MKSRSRKIWQLGDGKLSVEMTCLEDFPPGRQTEVQKVLRLSADGRLEAVVNLADSAVDWDRSSRRAVGLQVVYFDEIDGTLRRIVEVWQFNEEGRRTNCPR
jgi:hypothetical protein